MLRARDTETYRVDSICRFVEPHTNLNGRNMNQCSFLNSVLPHVHGVLRYEDLGIHFFLRTTIILFADRLLLSKLPDLIMRIRRTGENT